MSYLDDLMQCFNPCNDRVGIQKPEVIECSFCNQKAEFRIVRTIFGKREVFFACPDCTDIERSAAVELNKPIDITKL